MADIIVNTYMLKQYANRIVEVNSRITRLDWRMKSLYSQVGLLGLWNLIQGDCLTGYSWKLLRCQTYLSQTAIDFEAVEKNLQFSDLMNAKNLKINREKSVQDKFIEELKSNYGLHDVLKGAGYIGTVYDFINDIKKGTNWKDSLKTGVQIYQFMEGAVKKFRNYMRIGNAVGTKKAMAWWTKSIIGLKPLGRASTAKNPITRFVNNLTNKTSPFRAQFENIIKDFSGKNGVKNAVASWGTVAVTGVLNWFGNKEEQANSNGTMSDSRVVLETVTETVVDTALTYGSSIVMTAAVTTVLAVPVPGVFVVAVSGLALAGVNAGVKALTGKSTTEWISDTILDTGEAIGKKIGKSVKKVTSSVGSWFGKLSYVI